MSISKAEIEKIASLSRLKVSEAEAAQLTERIGNILAMVDTMQAVDTSGILDGDSFSMTPSASVEACMKVVHISASGTGTWGSSNGCMILSKKKKAPCILCFRTCMSR